MHEPARIAQRTRDVTLAPCILAYFKVDLDTVWAMVEEDLAPLKNNVRRILDEV